MNWDLYRIFLAVVRAGSLSRAAQNLSISQPTVSRRINDLERELDAKLFARIPDGIALTQAGERIFDKVVRAEQGMEEIERAIIGQDLRLSGTVTIATTEGLAHYWLIPKLRGIKQLYPDIDLRLLVGTVARNLLRHEADIALRVGDPGSPDLVGRRVGTVEFGLFASETYLLDAGDLRTPDDLIHHQIIGSTGVIGNLAQSLLLRKMGGDAKIGLTCNSITLGVTALQADMGLFPLPLFVAQNITGLQRVLERDFDLSLDLWLLTHRDLRMAKRIRACMNAIFEKIKADKHIFSSPPVP